MNVMSDEKAHQEIVNSCLRLLNGGIDFVEGCREVIALRNRLGLEADSSFLPFVGVVSETDDYPNKVSREHFNS